MAIPAFETVHGPAYQALFLVDNSQGHSAYAEDALVSSRMNVRPAGKQARMHDGWFERNGEMIPQAMIFPLDHPEFPNKPKGIKAVLAERGLFRQEPRGKCDKCPADTEYCCNRRILANQADFLQQRSLVQEVIENAGHLCIFLPKFHYELNFYQVLLGCSETIPS